MWDMGEQRWWRLQLALTGLCTPAAPRGFRDSRPDL